MTQWLTENQQESWRAWLSASLLLNDRLSRELQEQHGLTIADYEILVRLSEIPDRRMRMSDLADATLSSRSRLSHQIDRMENVGLVERQVCDQDRRGSFAVMTDKGWTTLVAAAPDHVQSVRTHLVDLLSAKELTSLGSACRRVADHLDAMNED
jgi:DNA-binding MarR family transcriptional regulator